MVGRCELVLFDVIVVDWYLRPLPSAAWWVSNRCDVMCVFVSRLGELGYGEMYRAIEYERTDGCMTIQ
jgi:hypothetical protein